jgi:hypothetical protein
MEAEIYDTKLLSQNKEFMSNTACPQECEGRWLFQGDMLSPSQADRLTEHCHFQGICLSSFLISFHWALGLLTLPSFHLYLQLLPFMPPPHEGFQPLLLFYSSPLQNWFKKWRMKANESKSIHITFTA